MSQLPVYTYNIENVPAQFYLKYEVDYELNKILDHLSVLPLNNDTDAIHQIITEILRSNDESK